MRARGLAVIGVLAFWPVAAAWQTAPPSEVERAFAKGGRVLMDLSAGDYTIRGGIDDRILVRWEARDAQDLKTVKAELDVQGAAATLRVRGPKNNFRVFIDLPSRSDLNVTLSAGDLKIKGLEGSKALDMWAGDVTIEVGDPAQYRQVDASVRFGEITSRPFGADKAGVFRSFSWSGPGKHSISAKLFAGDLKLVK